MAATTVENRTGQVVRDRQGLIELSFPQPMAPTNPGGPLGEELKALIHSAQLPAPTSRQRAASQVA